MLGGHIGTATCLLPNRIPLALVMPCWCLSGNSVHTAAASFTLAQLSEAQAALAEARATAESEAQRRAAAETTAGHLRSDLASAQDSLNTLEKVKFVASSG